MQGTVGVLAILLMLAFLAEFFFVAAEYFVIRFSNCSGLVSLSFVYSVMLLTSLLLERENRTFRNMLLKLDSGIAILGELLLLFLRLFHPT